jgi:hypothetical protein
MSAPDAVFTLAAAKEHLRVTWNSEDALISVLLDAAVGMCEQYTRRAFTERVIKQFVAYDLAITDAEFYSPLWPVKSVVVNRDGPVVIPSVLRTGFGYAVASVAAWPGIGTEGDVAWIEWTVSPDANDVPPDIIAAVHLALGDLYANRESNIVGTIISPNPTLRAILQPYVTDMTV